jgi:hypothetical protein
MNLISNLGDLILSFPSLGDESLASLSTILTRLQAVDETDHLDDVVLIDFKKRGARGDLDGIFELIKPTNCGCRLYEYQSTVS